jgi:hypothetical protein
MATAGLDEAQQRGEIEQAVLQIRNADSLNVRWQPRAAFVRPATIAFSSQPERRSQMTTYETPAPDASMAVVTTDLSVDGAGILTYSSDQTLPGRVTLVIDDVAFNCDVRWTSRIGHRVYRYGLLFHSVCEDSPSVERSN